MSISASRRQVLIGGISAITGVAFGGMERSAATRAAISSPDSDGVTVVDAPHVNVREHGAMGDDTTDDSDAIRRAVALATQLGWPVYFPAGTYLVSPDESAPIGETPRLNFCLRLEAGVRIVGDGQDETVLKLAGSSGEAAQSYAGIIGPARQTQDLSGLSVSDLTIDMNGDNNWMAGTGGALIGDCKPRGLAAWRGRGIVVQRVRFRNGQCVWYLQLAATSTTSRTEDATVDLCSFEDAGRGKDDIEPRQDWDHTSVYIDGVRATVTNNIFTTTKIYGARAALELHGGPHFAANNTVRGYLHGIHVVGSDTSGPGSATVIDNTVHDVHTAFVLWSAMAKGHTHGLRDVTIANNDIVLINDRNLFELDPNFTTRLPCSAVITTGGPMPAYPDHSGQPWENITIAKNKVQLDPKNPFLEEDKTRQLSSTFSIVRNDDLAPGSPDRNLVIDGNIVTGSVAGGVRVTGKQSSIEGLRVTNNSFTKLGSQYTADNTRNSAVFLSKLRSVRTVEISQNTVTYSLPTGAVTFATLGGAVGSNSDGAWDESVGSLRDVRLSDNMIGWAGARAVDNAARPMYRHVTLSVARDGSGIVEGVRLRATVDGWVEPDGEPEGPLFTTNSTVIDSRDRSTWQYVITSGVGRWVKRTLSVIDPEGPTFTPGMTTFSGTGLPGATVTLQPQEGLSPASGIVNADGTWNVAKYLGNGPYDFTISMTVGATMIESTQMHLTPAA